MLEELKQMNAELEELKKQHLEKSKILFGNVSKALFEKHPLLESFSWPQYTPYFNDGDECTFSAHVDEPDMNGIDGYEIDFSEPTITEYGEYDKITRSYPNKKDVPNPKYNPELGSAYNDVKEFLQNINEEVLRDLFGDHIKVTVRKSGVQVEKYSHD
jgi:hypothetical protein